MEFLLSALPCFCHNSKGFYFVTPRDSASVNWEIEKVTLSDEGAYDCIAVSSAGTGRAQTFFDVSGNYH